MSPVCSPGEPLVSVPGDLSGWEILFGLLLIFGRNGADSSGHGKVVNFNIFA